MLCLIVPCHAQDTAVNNLDLYQREAPVTCSFTATDNGDSLVIYAALDFKESTVDPVWVNYSWYLSGKLILDSALIKPATTRQIFKWAFALSQVPPLVTINLIWKARDRTYQEHFPADAYHASGGVSLRQSGLPVLKHWINTGDSIYLSAPKTKSIFVYYYGHPFDPARPPMTVNPVKGNEMLSIDSIEVLTAETYFIPYSPGLYFFQADSTTTEGASIVVTDRTFPQPRKISDLTEPLIYITTRMEYQKLKEDLSDKQAFDKFWLSTVGSADKARSAIKDFYQNVEDANALFTSYKEGWKTDRGMIYTVLGPPLSMTKEVDSETWIYQTGASDELRFVFKKISNIFSNNHYELFRDNSYDRPWFLAIDKWRKGQIR